MALGRDVRRKSFIAAAAANAIGAALVAAYVLALSPGRLPGDFRVGESVAILVVYLAVTLPLGDMLVARASRPAQERMRRGLPLSREDRASLVALSWRSAVMSFVGWAGAAVLFTVIYALRYGDPASQVLRFGLTIALGGLTTAALVFLLNDRAMRPIYALVFADDPPRQAEGMQVRLRLVLAWVLGAGVPLIGIALSFFGTDRGDYSTLVRGILTLVPLGLLAGALITVRMARSVSEPLEDLRGALDRVRRGDLDTKAEIDDVTEIGLLQAGFNEMVAGLRERAELEDLFGRHVGVDVARRAVEEGGVVLGGEQRELSALFVDVVGSTTLAATRAPEEVVALLNDVFEAVVEVASAEGGSVNKFEGDAALCVFGAPAHDARHAEHALRAARRLHEALDGLAHRHPGLDAGIGVSAGVAVAGNVGAEARFEYTVIGDPVNEAARLTEQAKARPGRVLASGDAIELAGGEAAHWSQAATLDLRGRTEATVAWEPISRTGATGSVPSRTS